mmetsp:Transcript_581/g.1106  ORF Transcript_581/g.1106 Transcript_581/m.1106 type:complete len:322 (+) Transcript_581:150-1115(+)
MIPVIPKAIKMKAEYYHMPQQVPLITSQHIQAVNSYREKGLHWTTEFKGRWFDEEIAYFEIIYELFQDGILANIEPGTTFREWASEILQCDTMRISKKFTGDMRIGHLRFPRQARKILSYSERQLLQSRLDEREAKYMAKRALIRTKKRNRVVDPDADTVVVKANISGPASLTNEEAITSRVLLELRGDAHQENEAIPTPPLLPPQIKRMRPFPGPSIIKQEPSPPAPKTVGNAALQAHPPSHSLPPQLADGSAGMQRPVDPGMFAKIRSAIYQGFQLEPGHHFLNLLESLTVDVLDSAITIEGAIEKIRLKFRPDDTIVF